MATVVMAPPPSGQSANSGSDAACNSDSDPATTANPSYPRTSTTTTTTDLINPILEEQHQGDSESETPNEPITPVSGRLSQEFTLQNHKQSPPLLPISEQQHPQQVPQFDSINTNKHTRAKSSTNEPLVINTALRPQDCAVFEDGSTPTPNSAAAAATATAAVTSATTESEVPPTPLSRRGTRGSTSGNFKRTMSNIFKRTSSNTSVADLPHSNDNNHAPPTTTAAAAATTSSSHAHSPFSRGMSRRFSMNRSSVTTRSNSPPSPPSAPNNGTSSVTSTDAKPEMPTQADFDKKSPLSPRSNLTLFNRAAHIIQVVATPRHAKQSTPRPDHRRASSFDAAKQQPAEQHHHHHQPHPHHPHHDGTGASPAVVAVGSPFAFPPEAGTGLKARRMSLSLPDDFNVDVVDLLSEYEYQHNILGWHGKHLGKGATSKVSLMNRKGCPDELFAVKEFRGKSSRESQEEYEKKVKSEYSIAKSLHHPNIVETFSLGTHHGRWNHVMEICTEGDLFSMVQKSYLKQEARLGDRLCLFKQLTQGINYLHENGIAHRDIKLENLLLTKDSKLKITDFGVSEVFAGIHPGLREAGGQCGQGMGEVRLCSPGICGSDPYIAPEVLSKRQKYDPRALDVWSSAIVMIYLTFGGAIWRRAEPGEGLYDDLVKGWSRWNTRHPAPDDVVTESSYPSVSVFDKMVSPPALRRVLLQMLNPDPAKRISMREVVNNRWVRNIECCQLESYDDPTNCIDASKKPGLGNGPKKIFCHNHLPPSSHGHSLGKMPGQAGY